MHIKLNCINIHIFDKVTKLMVNKHCNKMNCKHSFKCENDNYIWVYICNETFDCVSTSENILKQNVSSKVLTIYYCAELLFLR